MDIRKYYQTLKVLEQKYKSKNYLVEELLKDLTKMFGKDISNRIFNRFKYTGIIGIALDINGAPIWYLTRKGKTEIKFWKYIFEPSKEQKIKQSEENKILEEIFL